MNNVKTPGSAKSKRLQRMLTVFLVVTIPAGYYLFFFMARANLREVVAQKVYRSGQPSPAQLRNWVCHYGIKTVINLRGRVRKTTEQEESAANDLGIKMITIRFKSSSLPNRNSLAQLIEAIDTAEQPLLIHCRDGVDRVGFASTLAAMAIGKEDYDTAKWQAYVPPGPWKRHRNDNYVHISDALKLYEKQRQAHGVNTDDWQDFKQWSTTANAFADMDTKYRRDYCHFSQFNQTKWFYPFAKLLRDAWLQFAVELAFLSSLAVVIYRRLLRN